MPYVIPILVFRVLFWCLSMHIEIEILLTAPPAELWYHINYRIMLTYWKNHHCFSKSIHPSSSKKRRKEKGSISHRLLSGSEKETLVSCAGFHPVRRESYRHFLLKSFWKLTNPDVIGKAFHITLKASSGGDSIDATGVPVALMPGQRLGCTRPPTQLFDYWNSLQYPSGEAEAAYRYGYKGKKVVKSEMTARLLGINYFYSSIFFPLIVLIFF